MASISSFHPDLKTLLAPIPGTSSAGENLQYSDVYDQIREAQREDDPSLNRGVWVFPLKKADWPEVERLCIETLQKKSKDLQVTSGLIDAWVHLYGFAGLSEGLRLVAGLVSAYGDHFFPPGADDLDYRLSPIEWLNENLPVRLRLVPITNPTADSQPCSFSVYESSSHSGGKKVADDGRPDFQHSVLLTPTEHFTGVLQELESALSALGDVDAVLEEKLGKHAPSLRQLWSVMEPIRNLVTEILSQRDVPVEEWMPTGGPPDSSKYVPDHADPGSPVFSSRPIRSRDEAYQVLTEAAEFLARTEPHSPTPYLVRRAISWGMMSLEDLLPELVRNGGELQEICRLLNIPSSGKRPA